MARDESLLRGARTICRQLPWPPKRRGGIALTKLLVLEIRPIAKATFQCPRHTSRCEFPSILLHCVSQQALPPRQPARAHPASDLTRAPASSRKKCSARHIHPEFAASHAHLFAICHSVPRACDSCRALKRLHRDQRQRRYRLLSEECATEPRARRAREFQARNRLQSCASGDSRAPLAEHPFACLPRQQQSPSSY